MPGDIVEVPEQYVTHFMERVEESTPVTIPESTRARRRKKNPMQEFQEEPIPDFTAQEKSEE